MRPPTKAWQNVREALDAIRRAIIFPETKAEMDRVVDDAIMYIETSEECEEP